jgi:hypothetical protein
LQSTEHDRLKPAQMTGVVAVMHGGCRDERRVHEPRVCVAPMRTP